MATLRLERINKVYENGYHAVRDLDLAIEDGEFFVLVGPSGCGKTTALRMIAGIEEITTGRFHIGDVDATNSRPQERNLAMVFQNFALYPHMSVFDNIAFGLQSQKLHHSVVKERVARVAATLDLTDLLDRRPSQLSGGQQQRVAMGRAIVRRPSAFLMDEPLSHVDAKVRVELRTEIGRMQADLGVTTVYITHDQIEAMTLGTRVGVMKDGELQQVDTPQHLYDSPKNMFVGAFVGSPAMNLFGGRLGPDAVQIGAYSIGLPATIFHRHPDLMAYVGSDVVVGIRPEHIDDATTVADADEHRHFRADVRLVENLGNELIVHFDIGTPLIDSGDPDAIDGLSAHKFPVARLGPLSECNAFAPLDLVVRVDDLYFFDPVTTLSIEASIR